VENLAALCDVGAVSLSVAVDNCFSVFWRSVASASLFPQVAEAAMLSLCECWRRSWPYRFFAELEPIDRATALIALVLSAAIAVSVAALVRSYEAESSLAPGITAPPFELGFA
jgi:hypothetical protein